MHLYACKDLQSSFSKTYRCSASSVLFQLTILADDHLNQWFLTFYIILRSETLQGIIVTLTINSVMVLECKAP